jgi:hypothetical protein
MILRNRRYNRRTTCLADIHSEGGLEIRTEQDSALDKQTLLRLISASFSFFVAGINDGGLGVLIPWVVRDYGINTAILSSV